VNDRLERYAELAVRIGANVAPGQILAVTALVEHAPFVRAVARAGYAAGARCVDVNYVDSHVRKAFIEGAPEELLEWSPPWKVTRQQYLGDERGAEVSISGDPEPNLLADVDGDRVGRSMPRELMELSGRMMLDEQLINWTGVAFPNAGWAETIFGEPDVERLWELLAFTVRLDEPDPVAAWREHLDRLTSRADALNERRFDALHFHGGGTDLTIGLLPDAASRRRASTHRGAASTCRTCPPRRYTSRRTFAAPRASSARQGRWHCWASWSKGSSCASTAERSST